MMDQVAADLMELLSLANHNNTTAITLRHGIISVVVVVRVKPGSS